MRTALSGYFTTTYYFLPRLVLELCEGRLFQSRVCVCVCRCVWSISGNSAHLPRGVPQLAAVRPVAPARPVPCGRSRAFRRVLRRRVGVDGPLRHRRRRHVPAVRQTQGRARLQRQGSDGKRTCPPWTHVTHQGNGASSGPLRVSPAPWKGSEKLTNLVTMWASAQRDGRPVEYRSRPLFNVAKFG